MSNTENPAPETLEELETRAFFLLQKIDNCNFRDPEEEFNLRKELNVLLHSIVNMVCMNSSFKIYPVH